MNVSQNELRRLTVSTLKDVDKAIEAIKDEATMRDISPVTIRDQNGNWVLLPLLAAKAQCLNTLTLLNDQRK